MPDANTNTPDWDYIRAHAFKVRKHLVNHYNDLVHRSSCEVCMAYFIGEQMGKADNE